MPFVTNGRLEDMLDEDAPARAARRITEAAGELMEAETRRNTPIDRSPFREKPGRPRGTARASIHRTDVDRVPTIAGMSFRLRVRTEDPVFPYIEWDTRPHLITQRRPGGSLRWRGPGGYRFAKVVHHPGTKGAHPFALGALKTEAELDSIARPALRRFAVELVRERRLAP